MITESIFWAIDNMITLCKDPNQRQSIGAVREMLYDYDENTWSRMSEEERDTWLAGYLANASVSMEKADLVLSTHGSEEPGVYKLFEQMAALQEHPCYQLASDMAYMQEHIELDEPLSPDVLLILSTKLKEASGTWFNEPLLHHEHLDAIRYLLEYGINEGHSPEFPQLSPENTLELLLTANNQVFGTLVEIAAINNRDHYEVFSSHLDITPVVSAIDTINSKQLSLSDKIKDAQEIASGQTMRQRAVTSEKDL